MLLWYFLAIHSAYAATIISNNISASGPGQTATETLSNDTTLTGNVTADDNAVVTVNILDTSGISGNITANRDGLIYLTATGNAWVSGNLIMSNGSDAQVTLSGDSVFSGIMDADSSDGTSITLTMNDRAALTGLLSDGSRSDIDVFVNDSASLSGGVDSTAGGRMDIIMRGNSSLSGGMTSSSGSGQLTVSAYDNVAIKDFLNVSGTGNALLQLNDKATFTGDSNITGTGYLVTTAANNASIQGNLLVSGGSTADMTFLDDAKMAGNVTNDGSGTTNMTLSNRSSLTGNTFSGGGSEVKYVLNDNSFLRGSSVLNWGTTDISLNGAGSRWYVTQSSQTSGGNGATGNQYASAVSNLSLANGAWVYLGAQNYAMNGPADRVQLDINTLSGNGNFELRPHVAGIGSTAYNDGDLIHVTNTGGSHSLYVPSAQLGLGGVAVNGEEILKLVHSIDGKGSFSLYQDKLVDIGHFSYKLVQQNNHWYLIAANATGGGYVTIPGVPPDPSDPNPPDPDDPGTAEPLPPDLTNVDPGFGIDVNTGETPINKPVETAANFMTANYLITYIELQTLLQRMGDLRHTRRGDAWIRGFGGRMNSKQYSQLTEYSMNYYGIQFGADKNIQADSDIESYHAGLYGLYGTEDDFYIDATAKYSYIRDKFTTANSAGTPVSGKGHGNAYILGLEMGKRFYFSDRREGMYIEPQVQGIYTHQEEMILNADNRLEGKMDRYDSTLVRAGGLIGYNVKNGTVPLNIYAKGSYVRELTAKVGSTTTRSTTIPTTMKPAGMRWAWGRRRKLRTGTRGMWIWSIRRASVSISGRSTSATVIPSKTGRHYSMA